MTQPHYLTFNPENNVRLLTNVQKKVIFIFQEKVLLQQNQLRFHNQDA